MKLKTLLSTCACMLLLSGSLQAGSPVPFKARFHGFAEPPSAPDAENVIEIVVPLHGVGTHIGQFDERLVHLLDLDTGEFTGYAEWTAANGDTFTTVFHGHLVDIGDPQWVSFVVTHTIVGGTGRFKKATGTFDGLNGRYNLVTGEDQGEYLGTITLK
jgi:hypothetical protein